MLNITNIFLFDNFFNILIKIISNYITKKKLDIKSISIKVYKKSFYYQIKKIILMLNLIYFLNMCYYSISFHFPNINKIYRKKY